MRRRWLSFANRETYDFALALVEIGDFAPYVAHVAPAHEQAEGHEAEHDPERVAAALGAARIRQRGEGVAKGGELRGLQRAARTASGVLGGGAVLRDWRGAHEGEGARIERSEPEFFRPSGGQVEVGVVLGEPGGVSGESPVGGFVNGAEVVFRIAETPPHRAGGSRVRRARRRAVRAGRGRGIGRRGWDGGLFPERGSAGAGRRA